MMPFTQQRPMNVIDLDEVRSVSGDERDVVHALVKLAGQDDYEQVRGDQSDRGDHGDQGDQVAQDDQVEQVEQGDQGDQPEEPVLGGHDEEASVKGVESATDSVDSDDNSDDSGGDTDSEEDDYEETSTDKSVTDDSEDDTDEESDSSSNESAHSRRTTTKPKYKEEPKQQKDKDETMQFDFEEVIDDASKTPQTGQIEDEDIGGEVVTAATTIAGASAVSCFHAKRSLLVGIAVAVLVACALYYIWRKFEDMKNKLLQLQQQQEMSLNDRDVQVISSQVLQDYLREEDAKEDTSDYSTSGTDTSAGNDALQTIEETSEEDRECLEDLTHDIADRSVYIPANKPPSLGHISAKEPPPAAHVPANEPPPAAHVPDIPEAAEKKPPPAACAPETSEALENGSPDDGEAVEMGLLADFEAVEKGAMGDSATPTDSADPGEERGTGIEEPTSDSVAPALQDPEKHASQSLGTLEDELEDNKPRRRSRRVKS